MKDQELDDFLSGKRPPDFIATIKAEDLDNPTWKSKVVVGTKPIRVTKRLAATLAHYGVKVGTEDRQVRHLAYQTVVTVPPLVFAIFEAAVQANYHATGVLPTGGQLEQAVEHYVLLAKYNGFDLRNYSPELLSEAVAAAEYLYLAKLLQQAGWYYDLLD
jgi:hypothetical protein